MNIYTPTARASTRAERFSFISMHYGRRRLAVARWKP